MAAASDVPVAPAAIVGIGASAGGLEAIEAFFSATPVDSGMAFVVVQHLSPDYKSMMVELLSRKTQLPVLRAEDGMVVEANHVYLIPPKMNLSIFHGRLLLEEQKQREGINLPVDIFLRSLAEDQAEKAVAVVLSGTGSDGTRGVRAVKESGGLVVVQDEASAKFDGMPRAAASTGVADFVLPPSEMPAQLIACLRHPYTSRQVQQAQALSDETGLTRLFSLLRARFRVDFTYYKPSTITRRVERRIAVTQMPDLDAYVRYAEETPAEIAALYRELLIGVTSFFRDPDVMAVLEEDVLPGLFDRCAGREIRMWVAGCSTGEEAYTLAILAREVQERRGIATDIKIFATDIDRDAIAKAGAGVFPESIAADLNPELLAKYFYCRGDHYQVARSIREMVVFAQHNLVKDPPFTRIDLVSCRNLLIYLQPNLQQRALDMFGFSLRVGGILLLGNSETVGDMEECFEPLDRRARIYRALGRARTRAALDEIEPSVREPDRLAAPAVGYSRTQRTGSREQERLVSRLLDALSTAYVPVAAVVNEHLEVLYTLGDARDIFAMPSGRAAFDLNRMVNRELAIPLATGIQKVFRTGEELAYSNVRVREGDVGRAYRLRLCPLPGRKSDEALVVVFFEQVEAIPATPRDTAAELDLEAETSQRLADLEAELQFTRESLQATIEELETSNEELQATNEELLSSNEELQSTNEELQSTNEELYTVNTEYQIKIIELTEARNDVDNLLSSSRIGTLILDEDLCIRRYSPQAADVFNLVDADIGRPLRHLNHHLRDLDPLEAARSVQQSGELLEHEVQTDDGQWHLLRVLPYRIGPQAVAGVVFTLVDITPLREVRERLAAARQAEADLVNHMPSGLMVYEVSSKGHLILRSGNAAAERITGLPIRDGLGKRFTKLWPGAQGVALERRFVEAYRSGQPLYEPELHYSDPRFEGVFQVHVFGLPSGRVGVAFTDMTERKRAEADLVRTQALLTHAQAMAHVGSWELDLVTNILWWSDETYAIFGLTAEEFEPSYEAFLAKVHPDDRLKVDSAYQQSLSDGRGAYEVEHRIVRADGVVRTLLERCSHERDEQGRVVRSMGMVQDVTEIRAGEERQRSLCRLLSDAEAAARMGSWTWDVGTDTVTWSENLFRLFGRDPAAGAPSFAEHDSLYEPESMDRLRQAVDKALTQGLDYTLRLQALRADGSLMACVARGRAERDASGAVCRLYGSLQEVDE